MCVKINYFVFYLLPYLAFFFVFMLLAILHVTGTLQLLHISQYTNLVILHLFCYMFYTMTLLV
jgi:hypothetical protein